MSTSENHAPAHLGRRLITATLLALALTSGAMAATTGTAAAEVAKPRLESAVVATTTGAGTAPSLSAAGDKCLVKYGKRQKRSCKSDWLAKKTARDFGKKLKKLGIDQMHKRADSHVCERNPLRRKCRGTGDSGNSGNSGSSGHSGDTITPGDTLMGGDGDQHQGNH